MKAILFCRVSSKEQEETGYSLDAQKKILEQYADGKGFETAKVFRVSESASGKQVRKLFNEMLRFARKEKIEIICCEKIDRLTRNPKDAGTIDDWIKEGEKNQVHFFKENFVLHRHTPAHENLVWDMKVAIARFYTNNLAEEVRKGQKEKIAQGWLPSQAKLGYKTVGEKGHKTHVIDTEKAPYIKQAFELYHNGNYSTPYLSEVMYKEGLRNHKGKKVGKSRMYDLLSDPFYCGKMRWKGEILPGKHEPIISIGLFKAVKEKLNRKYTNPHFKRHLPVFKGKMTCGGCTGTVTWETQKGHWYGHCNHYRKCDQNIFWRQEKVEKELFAFFDKIAVKSDKVLKLIERGYRESTALEGTYFTNKENEINKVLETANKRLEAIYEDKIDGRITVEFYEKKRREYNQDKTNAIEDLQRMDGGRERYYRAGFAVHELAFNAVAIYQSPNATVDDKRLLISKIFSNLELNAENIRAKYTLAFQFLVEWIPKLNSTFEPENILEKYTLNNDFGGSHPILLAWQSSFRTYLWEVAIPDPEVAISEINHLRSLVNN